MQVIFKIIKNVINKILIYNKNASIAKPSFFKNIISRQYFIILCMRINLWNSSTINTHLILKISSFVKLFFVSKCEQKVKSKKILEMYRYFANLLTFEFLKLYIYYNNPIFWRKKKLIFYKCLIKCSGWIFILLCNTDIVNFYMQRHHFRDL